MSDTLRLSCLGHTWLIDLDGTIVKHNGYKIDGEDSLLEGAKDFLRSIPAEDKIIFLTSRKKEFQESTESFLRQHEIRYDSILYDLPYGERILLNDRKESGLETAIAVNKGRNTGEFPDICFDSDK